MATKQQSTAAVENESAVHWAGNVAGETLDREAQAQHAREDAHTGAAHLRDRVELDAVAFFQRVAAAMGDVARIFNARVGVRVLDVDQTPGGTLSIRSRRERRHVVIVPDLKTDLGYVPGPIVLVDDGRETQTPYRFVVEGDQLRLWCHGESLSPEGLTQRLLTPWLSTISLDGR